MIHRRVADSSREVGMAYFNTEVFEVSDAGRFKEAMMKFQESLEGAGGSDVRVFRNVDKPNQVFTTMWWPSVKACHTWAGERRGGHESRRRHRDLDGAGVSLGGDLGRGGRRWGEKTAFRCSNAKRGS
jgi:hypothetical protein